jgi:ribosome-associated heat shock protein Hsp15
VFARFAKTRSTAQALLVESRARIDGRPVSTPHADVRAGSVLVLMLGERVRVFKIAALPVRRGPPAEARACYVELEIDGGGG